MAVYLPIVGVLLLGGGLPKIVLSVAIAITAVALVLVAAVQYGRQLSQFAAHESDEIILLTIFGAVLLVVRSSALPSVRSDWGVSGGDCRVGSYCGAVTSAFGSSP